METSTTPIKPSSTPMQTSSNPNKKPTNALIEQYKQEEGKFKQKQDEVSKECYENFGNGMTRDEFDDLFDQ